MDTFLNTRITPKKEYNGEIKGLKIVISTCLFLDSLISINEKTYSYINGLISNIETFQYKINDIILQDKTVINTWIYRIYIDSIIFKIPELIAYIRTIKQDNTKKFNNDNKDIIDYDDNLDAYLDFSMFLSEYIAYIKLSRDDKYKNIEIYEYENPDTLMYFKTRELSDKHIAGHIDTFGTLIRYHPLTEDSTNICILRNCSFNLTPIDLLIQHYWITYRSEKLYMTYAIPRYKFIITDKLHSELKKYGLDIDRKSFRFGAGLTSIRTTLETKIKIKIFFNKMILPLETNEFKPFIGNKNNALKNEKYKYGIDEIILYKLLENLIGLPTFSNNNNNNSNSHNEKLLSNIFVIELDISGADYKGIFIKLEDNKYWNNFILQCNNMLNSQYSICYLFLSLSMIAKDRTLPSETLNLGTLLNSIDFYKKPFIIFNPMYLDKLNDILEKYRGGIYTDLLLDQNNNFIIIKYSRDNILEFIKQIVKAYSNDNYMPYIINLKDIHSNDSYNKSMKKQYQHDSTLLRFVKSHLSTLDSKLIPKHSESISSGGSLSKLYRKKTQIRSKQSRQSSNMEVNLTRKYKNNLLN